VSGIVCYAQINSRCLLSPTEIKHMGVEWVGRCALYSLSAW